MNAQGAANALGCPSTRPHRYQSACAIGVLIQAPSTRSVGTARARCSTRRPRVSDLGTAFCTQSTLTERAPSSEELGAREVPCLRRQRHFGRRRGVVTHFQLYQVVNGTVVSRPMKSSCRRRLVRRSTGDPPGRLWIFSLSTRRGATYFYRVTLNDASAFTLNFTVKTRAPAPSSRRRNGRELADFRAAQTRRWRPVRSPQA